MKIATRDFGEVEISGEAVLTFRLPILGFEEYRKFVILFDEDVGQQFAWLQSAEEPGLCFMLFDPEGLREKYAPVLPTEVDEVLEGRGEYNCWVLASVGKDFSKTTVNLKSPIIVCGENQFAAQVVLEQSYPIRYPLIQETEGA